MNNNSKKKQEFKIDAIKTPSGNVPTVDSFHKVVDGLFGEVLDTRKDIAKLIPNLEKELQYLKDILAQQMVLFEIINDNVTKIQKVLKTQGKEITKIQQTAELGSVELSEVGLSNDSIRAVSKLIQTELSKGIRPISDSLKQLEREVVNSKRDTLKTVEKSLDNIKDQIDDLSSKTELQMLEIVESLNLSPTKSSSRSSSSKSKKKLTS